MSSVKHFYYANLIAFRPKKKKKKSDIVCLRRPCNVWGPQGNPEYCLQACLINLSSVGKTKSCFTPIILVESCPLAGFEDNFIFNVTIELTSKSLNRNKWRYDMVMAEAVIRRKPDNTMVKERLQKNKHNEPQIITQKTKDWATQTH